MRYTRESNKKAAKKNYRTSKLGYLKSKYKGMLQRVRGKNPNSLLYSGLPILTQEEFLEWSLGDTNFNILWDLWQKSDHDRRNAPSIDRINREQGYTLCNIRFITHSENCRLARL